MATSVLSGASRPQALLPTLLLLRRELYNTNLLSSGVLRAPVASFASAPVPPPCVTALRAELNAKVVGHADAKDCLLLGLVAREHVYLQGEPGEWQAGSPHAVPHRLHFLATCSEKGIELTLRLLMA